MAAFSEILKDLSMSAGAAGAVMIDWDGEVVAAWAASPQVDIDLIGTHHEIIFDLVKEAASKGGLPAVRHMSITTDRARLAITTIKDGYCLVMTLERERPIGKALYESGKAVERIEEEMG